MLEAFKIKEFDLEPIYQAWEKPPRFYGESKRDMPVDDFLQQIKAGCVDRKVPEEYWHKVAQHYMGPKARARLQELKSVMAQVNGGKYRWSWKKFQIAMRNMGWEIDVNAIEPVQVHSAKSSGQFWLTRRKSKDKGESPKETVSPVELPPPVPSKQGRPNPVKMLSDSAINAATAKFRRAPSRANSLASTLTTSTVASIDTVTSNHAVTPYHAVPSGHAVTAISPPSADGTVTAISNAPTWLVNACQALNFLGSEHPRAMTTLSAVLITAGTLPAIPAISGGTVLASGVAQAVGAIAVGVGNLLKAQQEGQIQATDTQPHTPVRASTL